MLTQEEGPWDIFATLRRIAVGTMPGRALDCFYCTSVWVAAPLSFWVTPFRIEAVGASVVATVVTWLAMSGAAGLLYRITTRSLDATPLDS